MEKENVVQMQLKGNGGRRDQRHGESKKVLLTKHGGITKREKVEESMCGNNPDLE